MPSRTDLIFKDAAHCEIRLPGTEWMVSAYFVMVDDRVVLSELRIFPAEDRPPAPLTEAQYKAYMAGLRRRKRSVPEIGEWSRTVDGLLDDQGITAERIRDVRLGDLFEPVRQWATILREGIDTFAGKVADSPNPGRRQRSDRYYAEWALRISECTADPATRNRPIGAVADASGLTRDQVRDIAHEARRRKLLSGAPSGARGGGLLTERARQVLAQAEENQ